MLSIVWSVLPTRNTLPTRSALILSWCSLRTVIIVLLTRLVFTNNHGNPTLISYTKAIGLISCCCYTSSTMTREITATTIVFLRNLNISKPLPCHQPTILRMKNHTYLNHFPIIIRMVFMTYLMVIGIINDGIPSLYMS